MKTILGHVILASKDVLDVLMQFFTNHDMLSEMCEELSEREGGRWYRELLFVPQIFRYYSGP